MSDRPLEPRDPRGERPVRAMTFSSGWRNALRYRGAAVKLPSIALAAGSIVGALVAAAHFLHLPIFFTSWASSAALLLSAPKLPSCRAKRVGASHLIAAAVGLAVHALLPGGALAVGCALTAGMLILLAADLLHPPAMANAAIVFTVSASVWDFAIVASVGAVALALVAWLLENAEVGSMRRDPAELVENAA